MDFDLTECESVAFHVVVQILSTPPGKYLSYTYCLRNHQFECVGRIGILLFCVIS